MAFLLRAATMAVLSLFFAGPASATMPSWNLNDVSVLFALPQGGADAPVGLLPPQARGATGDLLPDAVYGLLPTLYQPGRGNETLYTQSLRVVGLRVDPCPPSERDDCRPEFRLVWQPVEFDEKAGRWLVRDAAIHAIYRLEGDEPDLLLGGLWALKRANGRLGVRTDGLPLGVHPALRSPVTAGRFSQALNTLVLRHARGDRLHRVTFTALRVPTRWWRFGALEKVGESRWQRVDIPRLDAPSVDIFNVAVEDGVDLGPERGLDAVFNVLPEEYPERDNLLPLINKGYRFNDARDRPVFAEKLDAVARFENPASSNADELDCASCHYTDAARYYAENRFPDLRDLQPKDRFQNPNPSLFDLSNTSIVARSTRLVRAFGYQGAEPAVSQRTINESAVVADWLNTRDSSALAANAEVAYSGACGTRTGDAAAFAAEEILNTGVTWPCEGSQ